MNAVWAYCRNGDRHFGHMTAWGNGFAVIGGTRINGVVFIDAAKSSGGGQTAPASVESEAPYGTTPGFVPATAASPNGAQTAPASVTTEVSPGQVAPSLPTDHTSVQTLVGSEHGAESNGEKGEPGRPVAHVGSATPLYGCRCGHSRHDHGPYAHCRRVGCLCDSYRSAKTNAAGHAGPAAL